MKPTKNSNGRSYIIQSVVGVGVFAALAGIVTIRVFSAPQLNLLTKVAIAAFLWGLVLYFVFVLRKYYRQLPDE